MKMIEMDLVEIQVTNDAPHQVIILQEKEGGRHFPIYIGNYEVTVLDSAIREMTHERPLTHDLALNIVDSLEGKLTGVVVDELRGNTFIGKLLVKNGHGEITRVDTRPSDAIILAMKRRVPIYVEEEVLASTHLEENESESDDSETGD
ncbi:bifunctional nuclease family protein [Candidatus Sumerlaeota bacterium]|nr:bifunctional nuclease family protein [Candidatus Sumerlaeota bacterium]